MINGVIIVKKEKGFTSHDVVAKLRGIVKQKKIGHTGTLDPEAEGVLPVCLGNATKLCDILTDKTKEYVAELLLGVTTDTQDMTGQILEEKEVKADEKQVEEAILSFLGSSFQIPPMYSALKINGKKLYELAREGKEVERKPRPIEIYELQILSIKLPVVKFRVLCSKGTYIRSLCADMGEKLSCGGCMQSLMRTKAGEFAIEDAHTLSEIEEKRDQGLLHELVIPVDRLFPSYRKLAVKAQGDRFLENGNVCPAELIDEKASDGEKVLLYHSSGAFYGIYTYEEGNQLYKPYKMFLPKE